MTFGDEGSESHPTPQESRARWWSLLSAVSINAVAGTLFAWSVFSSHLAPEFGVPVGRLGMVFSGALVVFSLAVLFGGGTVDRYGPRRVTVLAGVLSASGLTLAAFAPHLLILSLGISVLFGFGSGLAYVGAVAWAATWGGERRAGVIGVVVAAYAAGPVVAGPIGAWSTDRWGWSASLGVAAVVVAGVMVLASRGLPGPPPRRRENSIADAITGSDTSALASLWLWFFGSVAPGLFAFAYAAQMATERGVAPGTVGLVVALMAVANIAGRLLAAPLSTRIGLLAALWISGAVQVLVLTTLTLPLGGLIVVLSLTVLALHYGAVSTLLPLATRQVCSSSQFGRDYGRVFSSWGLAALMGPAMGAVFGTGPMGFTNGFRTSLITAALAVLALGIYQRRLRVKPAVE